MTTEQVNGMCMACGEWWDGKDLSGNVCQECQETPSCHHCQSENIEQA